MWKFLILSLTFVGIQASGNFYLYNFPKSLHFKGTEEIKGKDVSEIISVSLGNTVSGNVKWPCLTIVDPFDMPKRAVAVYIDGIDDIQTEEKVKSFPIKGDVEESLNMWSTDLESSNSDVADIDLNQIDEAIVAYTNMYGEMPDLRIAMKSNNNLKPDLHSEDKQFLQSNKLFESIALKYEAEKDRKGIMILRASLLPIAKAHGDKSAAMLEAKKLISDAINKFFETIRKYDNDMFLVAIAVKYEPGRLKRAVEPPQQTGKNPLNLAEYYDEDFPVVFNIILWFMVVFAFALLAICYAIGSMDPGRDSIIYRMTSTRMKKDN